MDGTESGDRQRECRHSRASADDRFLWSTRGRSHRTQVVGLPRLAFQRSARGLAIARTCAGQDEGREKARASLGVGDCRAQRMAFGTEAATREAREKME